MIWTLRYASHLGYKPPEIGLFQESAGSDDPVEQIDFAAAQGFAGTQYARAVTRSSDERKRVRRALERHGMETGCIVWAGREICAAPLWGTGAPDARAAWKTALLAGCDVANEVNARHMVLFSGADPAVPLAVQHAAFVENLKIAAEIAVKRGVVLLLENMSRKSRTGTLLSYHREAYAVAKAVDHPNVRLIFDTSHVQVMDGDLLDNLHDTWELVDLVQIADNPMRLEPGTGEINFENVLPAIHKLGYRGLVELEYDWSEQSRACEQRGIDYLRAIDTRLTAG